MPSPLTSPVWLTVQPLPGDRKPALPMIVVPLIR
jgi:hypothetical protein